VRTLSSLLGNSQRLDGGAMFGNAPRALWSRWIAPDDHTRIPLACRAMLVRDGDRTILCEAGIGAFFEPALRDRYGVVEGEHVLLRSLAELGLSHEDVQVVVLSHLHFDHAGGILEAFQEGEPPRLLFPNAQFLVGRAAWERARHPHVRDRASFVPELVSLLEESGRLALVEGERHPLLGSGYRFHYSDGHTPGLMLLEVDMPEGPVVFAGDLIPGTAWVHLPITMGYDRFPELLIDEKRRLFEGLLERRGRLFYTHDAQVALSGLGTDARGRFVPLDPVAEVRGLSR
jgi:glyoxylase-like metal-dependent hydrolase (beta-lactamase superfamily II)